MAGGILGKIFGGDQKAELDSCCGAVSVTPEDETENEAQHVEAKSTDSSMGSC